MAMASQSAITRQVAIAVAFIDISCGLRADLLYEVVIVLPIHIPKPVERIGVVADKRGTVEIQNRKRRVNIAIFPEPNAVVLAGERLDESAGQTEQTELPGIAACRSRSKGPGGSFLLWFPVRGVHASCWCKGVRYRQKDCRGDIRRRD